MSDSLDSALTLIERAKGLIHDRLRREPLSGDPVGIMGSDLLLADAVSMLKVAIGHLSEEIKTPSFKPE